jgi:hypothetical protein
MIIWPSSTNPTEVKKNLPFIVVLTITLFLTGFSWQPVFAQDETHLETIEVSIYPKVESSSMTVIMDIKLADGTSLPKTLLFQIPANAQIRAVTNRLEDGSLSDAEKTVTTDGLWQEIELTASSPNIQIEYDDPNLTREDSRWYFTFEWFSLNPLDSLSVRVQQPSGVNDIAANPSLSKLNDETTGGVYHYCEVGFINAEESWQLTLSYILASSSLEVIPAIPIDETTSGRTVSSLGVIFWLLVAAVAILLLLGLYYWWFKRNFIIKRQRIIQGVEVMNPEKDIIFCHECGMLSQVGDDYCRNCGTQLQKTSKFPHPD